MLKWIFFFPKNKLEYLTQSININNGFKIIFSPFKKEIKIFLFIQVDQSNISYWLIRDVYF